MNTHTMLNRTGAALIGTYMRLALDLDIVRHGSVPAGAKLIAANHPTTTDPFYLTSLLDEPVTLLVTRMAFNDPLLGPLLRAAGHIEVDHSSGRAAFDEAVRRLHAGATIGIFPEGSLSPREGGLCRAKTGTVRLALEAGVPVIPVGIHLDRARVRHVPMTRGDLSETARWYLRGPYAITIGAPLTFTGSVEDHDYVRAMSADLAHRIEALSRESAARMAAAHPAAVPAAGKLARLILP